MKELRAKIKRDKVKDIYQRGEGRIRNLSLFEITYTDYDKDPNVEDKTWTNSRATTTYTLIAHSFDDAVEYTKNRHIHVVEPTGGSHYSDDGVLGNYVVIDNIKLLHSYIEAVGIE